MSNLEIKMAGYLTRLHVLEKMEAGDEFYFELGKDLMKDLEELLTEKQVFVAKLMAEKEYKEIAVDEVDE